MREDGRTPKTIRFDTNEVGNGTKLFTFVISAAEAEANRSAGAPAIN